MFEKVEQKSFPYAVNWHEITSQNGEKKQIFVRSFWSLKSLISFSGRVPRKYYWLSAFVYLYGFLCFILTMLIAMWLGFLREFLENQFSFQTPEMVNVLMVYILLIPFFIISFWGVVSVMVRRCHDLGKSGWYVLFTFVPIINVGFFIWLGFAKWDNGENVYWPETQYL